MKTQYKFIHFVKIGNEDPDYHCRNNKTNDLLGVVDWCGPWKQWVFCPVEDTIFSAGCLADIQDFMGQLK